MFRKILVPVDLSQQNLGAVEMAAGLATSSDGELILLHVIETIDDVPYEEIKDFYSGIEAKARELMEELVSQLDEPPVRIERRVSYGRRIREILTVAAEIGADLLVVHSHRIEPGRSGGGLGTLSHEVAVLADIPVLLVK